eukprot:1602485-Pyramimonas_sp.AAC.1
MPRPARGRMRFKAARSWERSSAGRSSVIGSKQLAHFTPDGVKRVRVLLVRRPQLVPDSDPVVHQVAGVGEGLAASWIDRLVGQ